MPSRPQVSIPRDGSSSMSPSRPYGHERTIRHSLRLRQHPPREVTKPRCVFPEHRSCTKSAASFVCREFCGVLRVWTRYSLKLNIYSFCDVLSLLMLVARSSTSIFATRYNALQSPNTATFVKRSRSFPCSRILQRLYASQERHSNPSLEGGNYRYSGRLPHALSTPGSIGFYGVQSPRKLKCHASCRALFVSRTPMAVLSSHNGCQGFGRLIQSSEEVAEGQPAFQFQAASCHKDPKQRC